MRELGIRLGRLPWEEHFYRCQTSSPLQPAFRPEVGVPEPAPRSAWEPGLGSMRHTCPLRLGRCRHRRCWLVDRVGETLIGPDVEHEDVQASVSS